MVVFSLHLWIGLEFKWRASCACKKPQRLICGEGHFTAQITGETDFISCNLSCIRFFGLPQWCRAEDLRVSVLVYTSGRKEDAGKIGEDREQFCPSPPGGTVLEHLCLLAHYPHCAKRFCWGILPSGIQHPLLPSFLIYLSVCLSISFALPCTAKRMGKSHKISGFFFPMPFNAEPDCSITMQGHYLAWVLYFNKSLKIQ